MDNAKDGVLHVSQNIPTRSDLTVSMKRPTSVQVHVSAVGPRFSSLSWQLEGDPEENEIDVGQKTPDKNSRLNCKPSCREERSDSEIKKTSRSRTSPRKLPLRKNLRTRNRKRKNQQRKRG